MISKKFYECLKPPACLKLLPILIGLHLSACSTINKIGTPSSPMKWVEREFNACLPTAILFKESLIQYKVWSEVVTYRSFSPDTGKASNHAIVVFNYPKETDNYWTYDFEGSFKIQKDSGSIGNQNGASDEVTNSEMPEADVKNPIDIARLAEAKRFRPRSQILGAEFLN